MRPEVLRRLRAVVRGFPAEEVARDLRENVCAVAEVLLSRMNVVSRQELERHQAALREATERLRTIQSRLDEESGKGEGSSKK